MLNNSTKTKRSYEMLNIIGFGKQSHSLHPTTYNTIKDFNFNVELRATHY